MASRVPRSTLRRQLLQRRLLLSHDPNMRPYDDLLDGDAFVCETVFRRTCDRPHTYTAEQQRTRTRTRMSRTRCLAEHSFWLKPRPTASQDSNVDLGHATLRFRGVVRLATYSRCHRPSTTAELV